MARITPADIYQKLHHRTPRPLGRYLHCAVMIPLFQIDGQLHLLFTRRSENLKRQPGDICFPGGMQEGNESPLETALRETKEELGIPADKIDILGQTDYMITTGGTVIFPFLGYVGDISPQDIVFNTDEVSELFTVPLHFFKTTQPEIHYLYFKPDFSENFPFSRIVGGRNYPFNNPKVEEYFYDYEGLIIWGITARITEHIAALIHCIPE